MTIREQAKELCDWMAPEFSRGDCEGVDELRRSEEVIDHAEAVIRAAAKLLVEALKGLLERYETDLLSERSASPEQLYDPEYFAGVAAIAAWEAK